ncbi:MAG TPA: bifunctional tetrahydrofolate synthase/dihydrofolate synthase [Casimicrobiaceae bacterium]|nr:bifunctional tetrahydrofolate synthase/dihydrofolate synthase [Casimicrobiaceae bacterium]
MTTKRPGSLAAWLSYLETLHPRVIAMGLERVRAVADRMHIALTTPVIVVGGTNGKGSTCAMLDAMLRSAGYRTGLYTSPHLMHYNERVVVDGRAVDDETLISAFDAVEDVRVAADEPTPLTYFEFGTLAALHVFADGKLDAAILEVGLGGRLDAVNIIDADVAVITSIDIDHTEFLGATREAIGREKAGIFRARRPAVCTDRRPPASVVEHARAIGARLYVLGVDYDGVIEGRQWRYDGPGGARFGLPYPALRGRYQIDNAATAIAALACIADRLPMPGNAIRDGLTNVELAGRFTVLPGRPTIVLDVAHNPHAAQALASSLGDMGFHPRTTAVVGMLKDKDVEGIVAALRHRIDRWHVASLPGLRGSNADEVAPRLVAAGIDVATIRRFDDVASAYDTALGDAAEADRIVVFGSFVTVAAVLAASRRSASSRS